MAKGSDFEREVAKELSMWFTENKRDDIFWRTQGSGARATIRAKQEKKTKGQNGDICATDEIGFLLTSIVTVELKKGYNDWNIQEFIDKNKKNKLLFNFISQCRRECEEAETLTWWLITRQDRRNKLLFFDQKFRHFLFCQNEKINKLDHICIYEKEKKGNIYCVDFSLFLKTYHSNIFKLNKLKTKRRKEDGIH